MSVVQWFLVGVAGAGLLWFWRWCVRWGVSDVQNSNVWAAMALGVAMVIIAPIWVPVWLVYTLCTNKNIEHKVRKLFPPL